MLEIIYSGRGKSFYRTRAFPNNYFRTCGFVPNTTPTPSRISQDILDKWIKDKKIIQKLHDDALGLPVTSSKIKEKPFTTIARIGIINYINGEDDANNSGQTAELPQ